MNENYPVNHPAIKAYTETENPIINFDSYKEILDDYGYFKEDYYGKTPYLQKAEKILEELLPELKRNPTGDFTNHPLNVQLQDVLRKQFGFHAVYILWKRTMEISPNAYAHMSADIVMDGDEFISIDKKNGYYDTKHEHNCLIYISSTMASFLDLTAEEYLALLLNTIGYNFDYSIYMSLRVLGTVYNDAMNLVETQTYHNADGSSYTSTSINMSALVDMIKTSNPGKKSYAKYISLNEKFLAKFPIFKKISFATKRAISKLAVGLEVILSPTMILLPIEILLSPVFHLANVTTRKTETFADSFATIYGYGPSLMTAISKMDTAGLLDPKKAKNVGNPLTRLMKDMAMANRYLIGVFVDGSGTADTRMVDTIKNLRREIASEKYPPDIVNDLNRQVDQIEKTYNTYVGITDEKSKLFITSFARKVVNDVFHGQSDFIAKLFPENLANISLEFAIDDVDGDHVTEAVDLTNAFRYYHGEPERQGFKPESSCRAWDEELYSKSIDYEVLNSLGNHHVSDKDEYILHLYTLGDEMRPIYIGSVNVKRDGNKKLGNKSFDWEWNKQLPIDPRIVSYLREEIQTESCVTKQKSVLDPDEDWSDTMKENTTMESAKRSELKDSDFGLPKERKYPLDTKEHVLSAIKFFNYVSEENEEELARNINESIDKFFDSGEKLNIHVGKNNRFSKYFNVDLKESTNTESEEINTMTEYMDHPLVQIYKESEDPFIDLESYMGILDEYGYFKEDYYGKSPYLKQAEGILKKLITELKINPLDDYTNHPLNIQLQDMFRKQFGFHSVHILWKRTIETAPNAFTLCSADIIMRGDEIIKIDKKNGYYDSSHTHTCVIMISSTMAKTLDLSAEEYMGLLLHEIGHNFDSSIYMSISVIMTIIQNALNIFTTQTIATPYGVAIQKNFNPNAVINIALTTNPGKKIYARYTELIEKILATFPIFKKIASATKWMVAKLVTGVEMLISLPGLMLFPVEVLLSPVVHLATVHIRKGETFADSFATIYGYAPALLTAISKMTSAGLLDPKKAKNAGNPLTRLMRDMALANRYLVTVFMDGTHGSVDTRMMDAIKNLRREIASEKYPPEVVKELNKQVNEIEKTYNTYVGLTDDTSKLFITTFTRKVVNDVFNGQSDFIAKLFPENLANISLEFTIDNEASDDITYIESEEIDMSNLSEYTDKIGRIREIYKTIAVKRLTGELTTEAANETLSMLMEKALNASEEFIATESGVDAIRNKFKPSKIRTVKGDADGYVSNLTIGGKHIGLLAKNVTGKEEITASQLKTDAAILNRGFKQLTEDAVADLTKMAGRYKMDPKSIRRKMKLSHVEYKPTFDKAGGVKSGEFSIWYNDEKSADVNFFGGHSYVQRVTISDGKIVKASGSLAN